MRSNERGVLHIGPYCTAIGLYAHVDCRDCIAWTLHAVDCIGLYQSNGICI